MTPEKISPLVSRLGALPFFPSIADIDARISIAMVLHDCAGDNLDRIEWTVNRCLQLWDKWEGPHELRALYCSRWPPEDGENAYSCLPRFAEGIPSADENRNRELLGAGEQKRLPAGDAIQLLREASERPRDRVDEISERMERERRVKSVDVPDQAEIDRIKEIQERNRKEPQP